MTTARTERIYDLTRMVKALEKVCEAIDANENIGFDLKDAMKVAASKGYWLMVNGMRPSGIDEDGSVRWPSQPTKSKTQEEGPGHRVSLVDGALQCDCYAGQNGNPCWARGATAVINRCVTIPKSRPRSVEGVFDPNDPPDMPKPAYVPIRERIAQGDENPWQN